MKKALGSELRFWIFTSGYQVGSCFGAKYWFAPPSSDEGTRSHGYGLLFGIHNNHVLDRLY